WSLSSGLLSAASGLTLSAAGVISGTPVGAGTASFTVLVTDSASQTATKPLSLTTNPPASALSITTPPVLPAAGPGASYSQTLAATGGTAPYTWSILTGSLPTGLNLSGAGVISGTATSSGTSLVGVKVTDSGNPAQTATRTLVITVAAVLTIDTPSLPIGVVGKAYQTTLAASGGSAPYSWSVASGSLPAGITLNSAGLLSGTASSAGTFSFVAQVTDAAASPQTATHAFA